MACAACGQHAAVTPTQTAAVTTTTESTSCRACILTRLALLWIVGVGGVSLSTIYWLVGFGPCGCGP
jgi:hypothetical protein